jgi:hypothetical protein
VKTRRGAAKAAPGGLENSIVRSVYSVKHRGELEEVSMAQLGLLSSRWERVSRAALRGAERADSDAREDAVSGWCDVLEHRPIASTMTSDVRRATSLLGNTDVARDAGSVGKGMDAIGKRLLALG